MTDLLTLREMLCRATILARTRMEEAPPDIAEAVLAEFDEGTDRDPSVGQAYILLRAAWRDAGLSKGIGKHKPTTGSFSAVWSRGSGNGPLPALLKMATPEQLERSVRRYADELRADPGDRMILMPKTFFAVPTKTKVPKWQELLTQEEPEKASAGHAALAARGLI